MAVLVRRWQSCVTRVIRGAAAGILLGIVTASAQPAAAEPPVAPASVEELAKRVRPSVVVVMFEGREGRQQGLGTGFVIDAEGLIATNLHVAGEARPLAVQLADGSRHVVTEVTASDRAMDLAILRIKPPAQPLVPLPLGDSDNLPDGLPVMTVGNPHGLQFSVVNGVVSGVREVDDRRMIQLAMPIEPGNSGGPVVDPAGRVVGIVTIKSLVTRNLGFAVGVNALKPLLEKPNPVPMSRWLTIGTLDATQWRTLFGGRWQQRGGRIAVTGAGEGFGGRSLCLSRREPPPEPFELSVHVKLGDESGAAGLAFHSDGDNRHYGFYPTAGKLRFTRFDGPTVFEWKRS
jgi:S1-C subfamily serine protease